MATGRRVILLEPGKVKIDEIEVPKAQKGAMIMRMSRATVCGSELHHWEGVDWIPPTGVVWGHEGIGTIYELGEGVATDYAGQPVKVGDRVVSTFGRACGTCRMCVNDQPYACNDAVGVWLKPPEEFPYCLYMGVKALAFRRNLQVNPFGTSNCGYRGIAVHPQAEPMGAGISVL